MAAFKRAREAYDDGFLFFSIERKLSLLRALYFSIAQRPFVREGGAIRTVQERALSGEEKINAALKRGLR